MTQIRDDNTSTGSFPSAAASVALADVAATAGLRKIHMVAWRDLEDPEAGGSELHASAVASHWARAGIEVTLRTSRVTGKPARARRTGYHVNRQSGRYSVFPRVMAEGLTGRLGPHDGLVEVWNGMPFFSPLWSRSPTVVFLHHVHAEMWEMVLPRRRAQFGWMLEGTVAPKLYRRASIVTLSESSRDEIVDLLGLPYENITVVPPGVHPRYSPGGTRSPDPFVLAVGRLVPVKRFDTLIDLLATLKFHHPSLRAAIVGEGFERASLEARIHRAGAEGWIELPGRVPDAELVRLYRSAWVLVSTSQREGWGMTVTEAGACGTPSVVTDIAGHCDAVVHGRSGFLASDPEELSAHLDALLTDPDLRAKLADGAFAHASRLTWEATARGTLEALAMAATPKR